MMRTIFLLIIFSSILLGSTGVTAELIEQKPDFVVSNIAINFASHTAKVTVKNQGTSSGDGGQLTVWPHQPKVQTCSATNGMSVAVGTLANGESKTFTFDFIAEKGNKILRAFVDNDCATTESNEGNNQRISQYKNNNDGDQVSSTFQLQRSGANQYLLPVKVGSQIFNLLVDTGSDSLLVFQDKISSNNKDIIPSTTQIKKSYSSGIRTGVLATAPVRIGPYSTKEMHIMLVQSPDSANDPSLTAKGADGIIGFRRTRGLDLSMNTSELDALFNLLTPQVDEMEFNLPPTGTATITFGSMPILDRAKSQYVFRAKAFPVTNPYNPSLTSDYTDLEIPFRATSKVGESNTGDLDILLDTGAVSKLVLDTTVAESLGYDASTQSWHLSNDDEIEINLVGITGTAPILPKFKVWEISVAPYSTLGVAFEAVLGINRWQEYVVGYDYRSTLNGGPDATISLLRRLDMDDALLDAVPALAEGFVPLPGLNSIGNDELPSADDSGNLVAFQSDREGGQGGLDIYLWDAATKGLIDLPNLNHAGHDILPNLSGDGRFLVFQSLSTRTNATDQDIYLYDLQKKTLLDTAVINSTADDTWPDISGDGRFITFASQRVGGAGGRDIYLYDREIAQFVDLPDANSAKDEDSPEIRSDGQVISYTVEAYAGINKVINRDIALYDLQQKKKMELSEGIRGVNTGKDELSPVLSTDGLIIAMHSNRKNPDGGLLDRDIYLVDLRIGIAQKFPGLNSDFDDTTPRFTAANHQLIFQSRRPGGKGGTDIYLYDLVASPTPTPVAEKQYEDIPLKPSAAGLFMVPVTVAGESLDLLVDTTLAAVVLFGDSLPQGLILAPPPLGGPPPLVRFSLGKGEVEGRLVKTDIQIGKHIAKEFRVIIAKRPDCALAVGLNLADAKGIFGLYSSNSATAPTTQGSGQPPTANAPMASLLPEINMVEFSVNPNGMAGMSLGTLPQIGGISKHNAFYTGIFGQMNAENPAASSVHIGIPFIADAFASGSPAIVGRYGSEHGFDKLNLMNLLVPGTLLKDRIEMGVQVASALGYDPVTGSWGNTNRVDLSLVMFGSDNILKIANEVPVIKIDVVDFSKKTYRVVLGMDYWSDYILGLDSISFENGGPGGVLFMVRHEDAVVPQPSITKEDHHFVPLPGLNGLGDDISGDISDDGQTIVFQSNRPEGMGVYDIYVYRVGKGFISYPGLNSTAGELKPTISGDGRLIAFQSMRNPNNGSDILVYDLSANAFLDLPNLTTPVDEVDPELNTDGSRLIFRKNNPNSKNDFDIVLYDLTNQRFVDTSSEKINSSDSEFSPTIGGPDSLLYAFERESSTNPGKNKNIQIFNRSRNAMLTTHDYFSSHFKDMGPNLSADGNYLAFYSDRNAPDLQHLGNDLFLYELSSHEFIFLPSVNSDFEDSKPAISSNAQYLLFQSKRAGGHGGYDLYLYKRDTEDHTIYKVTKNYTQTGQVAYDDGQVVGKTMVSALDSSGKVVTTATSNDRGEFSMVIKKGMAVPVSYVASEANGQVIVDGVGDDTYVPDFEAGNLKFTDVWVEDVMQSGFATTVRFNVAAEVAKYNTYVKLYLVNLSTGSVDDLDIKATDFTPDYALTGLIIPSLGQTLASTSVTNTQDEDTVTKIQYTDSHFLTAQVEHTFRLPADIVAGTYAVVFSIGTYDYDHTDDALQSESSADLEDNVLVAPASVIIGQPDKPNLRILSAKLVNNSLELPAKRLENSAAPPQTPDLSLNMEVESMAKDTTVPVHISMELQLAGKTMPLGILSTDENGRPKLQTTKTYAVQCIKESGQDRCASLFQQDQKGATYQLYLDGDGYDTLAALTKDTKGTLVIRLDPDGSVEEWENNRRDNIKEMPIMWLASQAQSVKKVNTAHLRATPAKNAARFYDDDSASTNFVSMTQTSHQYGSDDYNIAYNLGAELNYGDIHDNVPYNAEFDAGQNKFEMTMFGGTFTLLGLDSGAQFDGEYPYCSDMNVDITVLGVEIFNYLPKQGLNALYNLIAGSSLNSVNCKEKAAATQVEQIWSTQDINGNEKYVLSKSAKKVKVYIVGPIPITVIGGVSGYLGMRGSLQIDADQVVSATIGPYVGLRGFAMAGPGYKKKSGNVTLTAMLGVGINVTILEIGVGYKSSFRLDKSAPGSIIKFEVPMTLSTLGGSFYAFAQVQAKIKIAGKDIGYGLKYKYSIVDWDGFTWTIDLTDPRIKAFGPYDRYLIDNSFTNVAGTIDYTSTAPPTSREWAGTFNFDAGTYLFHLVTDDNIKVIVNDETLAQLPTHSSSTQVVDNVNGYIGTLTNGALIDTASEALTSATVKGSLDIDGSDDYVKLFSTPSTFSTTKGTIEHWVKLDSTSGSQVLFYVGDRSDSDGFGHGNSTLEIHTALVDGKPYFIYQRGDTVSLYILSPTKLTTGVWYHIAATYDTSSSTSRFNLYVNGVSVGSKTSTAGLENKTTSGVFIGKPYASTRFFNGKMDELRLWNTVRTQSEISSNMRTSLPATTSGLYAYFPFDDRYTAINQETEMTLDENKTWDVALTYTKDSGSKTPTTADIDFYWTQPNYIGYNATYYNTTDLSSSVAWRDQEQTISHAWGDYSPTGDSKSGTTYIVNPKKFSARWESSFTGFADNTQWVFQVTSDDGVQLYVDGNTASPVINTWNDAQTTVQTITSASKTLSAAEHTITLEYSHETDRTNSSGTAITVNPEIEMMYLPKDKWLKTGIIIGDENNSNTISETLGVVSDFQSDIKALGTPGYEYMQYEGFFSFVEKGTYDFIVRTNPGMSVTVDGVEYGGAWAHTSATAYTFSVELEAGYHDIRILYQLYDTYSANDSEKVRNNARVGELSWVLQANNVMTGYYYRTADDLEISNSIAAEDTTSVVDPILIRKEVTIMNSDLVTPIHFGWKASSPTYYLQPIDTELDSANNSGQDSFGVRWEGDFDFTSTDSSCNGIDSTDSGAAADEVDDTCVYLFTVLADDKVRLWVDGQLILEHWNTVDNTRTYHEITSVDAQVHNIRVEYAEDTGNASIDVGWRLVTANETYVNYFDSTDFTGVPINWSGPTTTSDIFASVTDITPVIMANETNLSPEGFASGQTFSGVGVGRYYFEEDVYEFSMQADSGAKLYVDGIEVIDAWSGASGKMLSSNWPLELGYHNIKVEMVGTSGAADLLVKWTNTNKVSAAGTAMIFDGIDDSATITSYQGITGSADRSVEVWFKTKTTDGERTLVYWGNSIGTGQKWKINTNGDGVLETQIGSGKVTGSTYIADGNWHHVAVTFANDGTPTSDDLKLYVDGTLEKVVVVSQILNTLADSDVQIGFDPHTNIYFPGQIDELRLWNVARSASEIQANLNKLLIGSESGLVAYYRFDDTDIGVLSDVLGKHNATVDSDSSWSISGAPIYLSAPGYGLSFDGVDDYGKVSDYLGITGTAARTVEAWINTSTTGVDGQPIACWGTDVISQKWLFRLEKTGGVRVEINGGNIAGTTLVNDGLWHHVAATFENDGSPNATDIKLYVDGKLETSFYIKTSKVLNTVASIDLLIGMDHGGRHFTGKMDELRIWSTARTQAEIQASMNTTLTGSESNLVLYYPFDDGSNNISAEDLVGSHNLTLYNTPTWIVSGAAVH